MFEASRETHHVITPHSHKFDFCCLVLRGTVENTIFIEDVNGDEWAVIKQKGELGDYNSEIECAYKCSAISNVYNQGQTYSMKNYEFHSIKFSKDAVVLFFEGEKVSDVSYYLEPIVDSKVLDTFLVKDWMFKRQKNLTCIQK